MIYETEFLEFCYDACPSYLISDHGKKKCLEDDGYCLKYLSVDGKECVETCGKDEFKD